jgi:hypothetical protein
MSPIRVQRRRTKGWRMPENTVVVTRPSDCGNPFRVGGHYKRSTHTFVYLQAAEGYQDSTYTTIKSAQEAVEWFRWYMEKCPMRAEMVKKELHGKNLACWCPLDKPCHADVLLEIANGEHA